MKKTIQFSILLMIFGIFLGSCGSSYSLTKRKHNKGYHISANKKYSTSNEKQELAVRQEIEVQETIENSNSIEKEEIHFQSTERVEHTNTSSELEDATTLKQTKHAVQSTDVSTVSEQSSKLEIRSLILPLTILKSINNNFKSTANKMQRRSSDQGLSLLWIVIIVLLVLWAIGYGGGISTSGLIHLLLLVALILLILWLLRVI
jgi:hypothetical protein